MSIITEEWNQPNAIPLPEAEIFQCGRGKVRFTWNFNRKEPFWFLYCNSEPGAWLDFSGKEVRPTGKEIILIPPNTPFRSFCESPFEHFFIHFNVGRPYSRVKPGVMIFDRSVCGVLDLLLKSEPIPSAAVYALLYSVLAAIPADRFSDEVAMDNRIRQAMILLSRGVSREEICRKIGMSQSNFQRAFREETGIAPHQYALHLRIERARGLLASGNADINLIAKSCDFSDRYAFSKTFKKQVGIPPAEYRKKTGHPEK